MKKKSNEIKTGIMVVACLLILLGLTVKAGGLSSFKKGYNLRLQFNYVSGIKKGAPVYLTGVEAGEVKDIKIDYTPEGTKVGLLLRLDRLAKVRRDSKAYITSMGLMGAKYIEITSGSKDAEFLKEGSLIIGKEPLSTEEIMDKASAIADNLNAGINDLRKLANDAGLALSDNRSEIDRIIGNMNETSGNLKEFSDDIKRNPWKLLIRTKEEKKGEGAGGRGKR